MGASFGRQIDPVQKQQLEWVPRSPDVYGGGQQGMRLFGLTYGEEVLFDASNGTIRDTQPHMSYAPAATNPTGTAFDQVYAVFKTVLLVSTLNQAISVQPMFSRDGQNWYPFGNPVNLTAYSGTGAPSTAVVVLSTAQQYIPYAGVQVTCSTAPTSGVLSGWLERLG